MHLSRFGFIRLSLSLLAFFLLFMRPARAQALATLLPVSGDAGYTMAIGFSAN
jgi:hypothetical protein